VAITFYEGAAGTGKTSRLFEELERRIKVEPLEEPQRILVFSRMHGARRRLLQQLKSSAQLVGRFECGTIDSFALRLVRRWRHLLRVAGQEVIEPAPSTFSAICEQAAFLLNRSRVADWFRTSYRFVVLDEGQDCREGQLVLTQTISTICDLVVAADEFQDLSGGAANPCVTWLRSMTTPEMLSLCHRTNASGLLSGASALREGAVPAAGSGLAIKYINAWAPAAHYVAAILVNGPTTILFPTGPGKSQFVSKVLDRLQSEPLHLKKANRDVGPFRVAQEMSPEQEEGILTQKLGLTSEDERIELKSVAEATEKEFAAIASWAEMQRNLRGVDAVTGHEVKLAVQRAVHQRRAHGTRSAGRYSAMTIHQAKNREFDNVIVLWPYEVSGDPEQRRRLLYNAITRARRKATVLIQGAEKDDVLGKMCAGNPIS